MTTRTFSVSSAGTGCLAMISEPTTLTGTSFCSRPPITETETILPPPSGIPIFAIPFESASRLAFADTSTSASAPSTTSTTSTNPSGSIQRRRRLRPPRVRSSRRSSGAWKRRGSDGGFRGEKVATCGEMVAIAPDSVSRSFVSTS